METSNLVRSLIEEQIEKLGFKLAEVIYEKEGNTYFLRVIIDKEGYINIEDCLSVNKVIGPILDEKDPIENSYILDVCSKEKGDTQNEQ